MMEKQVIGKRDEGRKLQDMTAGDPWAEAPFYGVGEGSEHVQGISVGDQICAIFHGLRVANKGKAVKERDYAILETVTGEKLRLFTPGQLKHNLLNVAVGTYVEITYLGMQYAEKLERDVHNFKVQADVGLSN